VACAVRNPAGHEAAPTHTHPLSARANGCMRNPVSKKERATMTKTLRTDTCELRVDRRLEGRLDDLRQLWRAYCEGKEEESGDLGTFTEYGLCFDYVTALTFTDQKEAYFRYQLSWGGPSEEFRFFVNPDLSCHRIEYWFLDWFDGANRVLSGDDESLMLEIWEWFRDIAALKLAEAQEDA
jgi:hypothetical protein